MKASEHLNKKPLSSFWKYMLFDEISPALCRSMLNTLTEDAEQIVPRLAERLAHTSIGETDFSRGVLGFLAQELKNNQASDREQQVFYHFIYAHYTLTKSALAMKRRWIRERSQKNG